MKIWDAVKLYGMLGLTLGAASSCASSRGNAQDDSKTLSVDTFRVAHVRYTPECDYVNLESIKNGNPTEQYNEIIVGPESETTFFGDTVLMQKTKNLQKIINISAQRRTHRK